MKSNQCPCGDCKLKHTVSAYCCLIEYQNLPFAVSSCQICPHRAETNYLSDWSFKLQRWVETVARAWYFPSRARAAALGQAQTTFFIACDFTDVTLLFGTEMSILTLMFEGELSGLGKISKQIFFWKYCKMLKNGLDRQLKTHRLKLCQQKPIICHERPISHLKDSVVHQPKLKCLRSVRRQRLVYFAFLCRDVRK